MHELHLALLSGRRTAFGGLSKVSDRIAVNTNDFIAVRRLEISIAPDSVSPASAQRDVAHSPGDVRLVCANGKWRADLQLGETRDQSPLTQAIANGEVCCVVGDADEVRSSPLSSPPYANACLISIEPRSSTIRIHTSLTGLPPVFVFRRAGLATISCPFLPETARGRLEPNPDGIADALRWGHPLDGRTLFAGLQCVRSAESLTVAPDGAVELSPVAWPSLGDSAALTDEEILRAQVAAFAESAGHIRTDNAFMSLSGGLDSRTSLVALLSHGRRIPCVTMASSPKSLDVQLAKAFCEAYGLEHHTVMLGEEFYRRCPELLLRSAGLTGGVACLSQTADLFLYESLPAYTRRISGNLGNQVGRGGVESLSAYQPRADVFSPAVRERLLEKPLAPWFLPRLAGESYGETLFGQEVHFWSLANYVVGSTRAYQLTPYADRRLMQLSRVAFARDSELRHVTWRTLRARDLRHRFAGTPRQRSFQRQFLVENDRKARHVPLNWGWRAAGGWSPAWCLTAMVSAADAALLKATRKASALRPAARWLSTRLGHRSALVDWPSVMKRHLRELTLDTFAAREVRQAGIFDSSALDTMLQEHFSGAADHYPTLSRALEIALGVTCRAGAHT